MPPTFHMNNFKPWARSYRKPFSPYKSPNYHTQPTQKSPRPKPYHDSLPSTLPLPKHNLPARPPAEVCVHINANTQLCTSSSSQSQPLEISVPEQNTYLETPKHGTTSPHDSAPHFSDPDPNSRCDIQDDTDIPINPAILANHWPWEDGSLQQSVPQADNFINSETTCSYPDPPPVLHSPPNYHRGSCEKAGDQYGDTQTSDHSHIHDHQQLHPSQHNTDPDAAYPDGVRGDHHVGGQSKVLSGRRNNQMGELTNGFKFHQCCRPGRIPSCFALTSCLPHLTIVCNSFLGYSKVLYHIACLALH
ncbi:uncharacterized protein EURHEDRAFT_544726 [Aspergillus ruber CBS 135680]|uniref:Uncharacterized protein n=1 Tax=Aspergillus ruber (strain CBS 135680) TaxID=1388766 RepID=A0A017SPX7_ASPRC|nr:uncharacterized protein EURHEDRAFT_544726 [Aspergillus ruber CBS 135680]EYE98325.1 hypothetical protein EURHEDRAFT_544726 [Aspergillus ruber CBS 135680]